MNKRNYRKSQLQTEQHLAKYQEAVNLVLTENRNYDDSRNNGHKPGNKPAHNRVDPQSQVAFHNNLTSQCSCNCGALTGCNQCYRKQGGSDRRAKHRRQKLMRLSYFCDVSFTGLKE